MAQIRNCFRLLHKFKGVVGKLLGDSDGLVIALGRHHAVDARLGFILGKTYLLHVLFRLANDEEHIALRPGFTYSHCVSSIELSAS